MPSTFDASRPAGPEHAPAASALAHAANQYAEARDRSDSDSASAWQRVIYDLVETTQHTLI